MAARSVQRGPARRQAGRDRAPAPAEPAPPPGEAGRGAERLPLASRLVCETGDLLAARDHLSRFLWPHSVIPTERGTRVAFRHCEALVGRASIHALCYGAPVKIDARPDDSYLFLILLEGRGTLTQDGSTVSLGPRVVRAMNPTGVATMRFGTGESNLTLRIAGTAMREWLQSETGRVITEPLRFEPVPDEQDADAPGLRRFLGWLCAEFDRHARSVAEPAVARQLEQVLISLVLTQLPHNYSDAMGAGRLAPAADYVRAAEAYVATHAGQPITLRDLAAAAGVSERTLQAGFRRYRDTTPMEYLRDFRLDLARTRLRPAMAQGHSVTDIALACGFNHLGKFAKCYRARFGESPSETRRRALDATPARSGRE